MPDALMSAAERAHGFHVNKNNLLAANLALRQVLNALGQQTGQGTVVDGEIAGFLRHFNNHWHDFWNLTILSWHNSTGAILTTTTTAADSSILLPVIDGNLNTCWQQDVRFVQVQVSVDYSYSIFGVSPLRLDFYIELPQVTSTMTNGGEWHILWSPMLDQPIFGRWTLPKLVSPFNLPLANWFSLHLVSRRQHLPTIALWWRLNPRSCKLSKSRSSRVYS